MSVVIPARNAAAFIGEQLSALEAQDYTGAWEVVVVDNGSTDATSDVARSFADRLPALTVVDAPHGTGVQFARGEGVRAASGDLLLFCDADDRAEPTWLSAMARAATEAELLGGHLEESVINDGDVAAWRPPLTPGGLPVFLRFLPSAIGANCGVRREAYEALGGFRGGYRGGSEDIDFFWRGQLLGYRLAYVPDAIIHYRHRPSLRDLGRQYYRYGQASALLYRTFRDHGIAAAGPLKVARSWGWVITHLHYLGDRRRRGVWCRTLAWYAGLARGGIRYRTAGRLA